MACEEVFAEDGFHHGVANSEWYKNLERYGSCLQLLCLLQEDPTLIHQLGPEGITVLHKGVEHVCVALVRFILVDMFDDQGLCNCTLYGADSPSLTREQLLRKTSSYGSTAVNMAVVSGSPKMVMLLKWAIETSRRSSGGSTKEMSSEKERDNERHCDAIYSSFLRERGGADEIEEKSANATGSELIVPDVKDDDVNILESISSSRMSTEVIGVIEGILEDPGEGIDKELMDVFKERCQKDVDFEFVPVAHVFPHFLASLRTYSRKRSARMREKFKVFQKAVLEKIVEECKNAQGGEEVGSGAMW